MRGCHLRGRPHLSVITSLHLLKASLVGQLCNTQWQKCNSLLRLFAMVGCESRIVSLMSLFGLEMLWNWMLVKEKQVVRCWCEWTVIEYWKCISTMKKNHKKIIDMTLYGVCNLKLIALVIIYKSLILNLQTGCNNKNSWFINIIALQPKRCCKFSLKQQYIIC